MDVMSDVLRMIHLEGALFLNGEFRAPWCIQATAGCSVAKARLPHAEHFAICHFVLEGHCWAQVPGEEALALSAGDAVVFPYSDAHLVGSGLQHASVSIDHIVDLHLAKVQELSRLYYGGQGEKTVLVCGWLAFEHGLPHPVNAALPRMFHTSLRKRPSGAWLDQSVRYALDEATARHAGSDLLAAKIAEALFVEALRGHVESLSDSTRSWLSGLRDPQVGLALAAMHANPARAWTVETLAQEVLMSRSAFADRFNDLAGMPPMQYLKRWRLALAARMLGNERSTLARVAQRIGYESESAFNRAFKQEYGKAPGVWRRG